MSDHGSPALARLYEPDPEAEYVAWDYAIVAEHDILVGDRLPGDHPAVQQAPWLFLRQNALPDEETWHAMP